MAFVVSSLTNYTNEQSTDLLVRALFSSKTASILRDAGQVQPNIKSASALNILTSTVFFQADGCGYSPSGSTTFTQRVITVGKVKIEETLCPKTLEAKWMQTQIMPGAPTELPFEEQIGREKAQTIADALETAIWQGDTGSGNPNLVRFDGIYTILNALGFGGSGDPVQGNTTSITSITAGNIIAIIDDIYAKVPSRVSDKDNVVCFMGTDKYKLYLQALKSANLFHFNPEAGLNMEMIAPGTNMRLIAVGGLSGTNFLVAGQMSNFFLGTDLMNEEEEYKFWYSIDNDEVRFRATFKYGTQVAFPDETVLWKI